MRWPDVVRADMAAFASNSRLMAVLLSDTTRIRAANDGQVAAMQLPLLEYTIVSGVEGEVFHPVRIQWDVLVTTDAQLEALELELFRTLHRDVGCVIGGLAMVRSQYVDRQELPGLPDGIRGSANEYLQEPARLRYVRAEES